MKVWVRLGLVMLLLAGLSACGQKGPLYLPDNSSEEESSTTTS